MSLREELEDRLAIEKPVDLLVADVLSTIDRATDFDERMMNHNFDVDWQAYADVPEGAPHCSSSWAILRTRSRLRSS